MPRLTIDDCEIGRQVRLASEYDHLDHRLFQRPVGTLGTVVARQRPAIRVRWDDDVTDGGHNPRWYLPGDFTHPAPDHAEQLLALFTGP